VDSSSLATGRPALSDSMYSVALGTLELTLYEQLHLFNMLYNNNLIEQPAAHPSLVMVSARLNGDSVAIADTIRRVHPFADINNVRPSWLGMYKRLTSNPADGLTKYDIADSAWPATAPAGRAYDPAILPVVRPLANFAKSGTTDDVIRPFNAGSESSRRTNYGLWNAVLRLDFARLSGDPADTVRDITIACVGEGSQQHTGPRDGKSLHKFLTAGLLKKAGLPAENGFFSRYETYLKGIPPDEHAACRGVLSHITENQE
jgi:hypothetical protein